MLHKLRISHKILLPIGVASTIIFMGMLFYDSEHERESILKQNAQARIEQIQSVVNGLKVIMISGYSAIAQDYADQLRTVPGIVDFRIMRLNGLEAFSDNKMVEDVNSRRGKEIFAQHAEQVFIVQQILRQDDPNLVRVLAEKRELFYEHRSKTNELLQTFLIPILNEPACHVCHGEEQALRGVVLLTVSLAHVEEAIKDARLRAGVVMIISLTLLLSLVSFLIRKTVVQSIHVMDHAMSRVAAGNLSLQVPVTGNDELGHMAVSFNTMVDQLLQTYTGFQAERNKLSTIILSAREGIIVTDQKEAVVLVNPAAERLLGKTSQQIVQGGFLNFMDDPDYVRQMIVTSGVNMPDTVVYNQRVLNVHAACICAPGGEMIGSAALLRDVTEQKQLEEKLLNMSYTDKLTGLFNRRRMEELMSSEFDRAWRYGFPFSFLLLDVDHFKRFNDQHGHDMGDRVLKTLGQLMLTFFRKSDSPCRYGGEEFCVILVSMPNEEEERKSHVVADRFRKAVEDLVIENLKVTVSIGVAVMRNREFESAAAMIKAADKALYRAKGAGRNRVMVADSVDM